MRIIVIGLGTQGYKRKKHACDDFVVSVDPVNMEADYKDIQQVPLDNYDAALVCTPDANKTDLLEYLLTNEKHVLVEKPFITSNNSDIERIEKLANNNNVVCYVAYNHRFEPHFMRVKELLDSNELGKIYRSRLFYGNGTARLVRDSAWRDQGDGVLPDLGSHLLDTVLFWFDDMRDDFRVVSRANYENKSPDHVVLATKNNISIELEMTLLSWRNHFTCDIFAEKGSLHISSLCKWGPTTLTVRKRVLPSGRPIEESTTLVQDDPTWKLEYNYFKKLCEKNARSCLKRDMWINKTLGEMA